MSVGAANSHSHRTEHEALCASSFQPAPALLLPPGPGSDPASATANCQLQCSACATTCERLNETLAVTAVGSRGGLGPRIGPPRRTIVIHNRHGRRRPAGRRWRLREGISASVRSVPSERVPFRSVGGPFPRGRHAGAPPAAGWGQTPGYISPSTRTPLTCGDTTAGAGQISPGANGPGA